MPSLLSGKKSPTTTVLAPSSSKSLLGEAPATVVPVKGDGGGVLNFIKDIPSAIVHGFTSVGNVMAQTGSTIGNALGNTVGKSILNHVGVQKNPTLNKSAREWQSAIQSPTYLPIPGQSTPIFESAPYKSVPQAAGAVLGAGIDFALLATTGGAGGAALSIPKAVAKEGVSTFLKSVGKSALTKVTTKEGLTLLGKAALADFAIGSGYGVSANLQGENPSVTGAAKSAVQAGLINVVATPVLGKTIEGSFLAKKVASEKIASLFDTTASKLEGVAGRAAAEKTAAVTDAFGGPGGKAFGDNFIYPILRERAPTLTEKAAGKVAGGIRAAEKAPLKVQTMFNRYAALAQKNVKDVLGVDIENVFQRTPSASRVEAQKRATAFLADGPAKHGDEVWSLVERQAKMLDAIDRSTNGLTVEGRHSLETLIDNYQGWLGTLTDQQKSAVGNGQTHFQTTLRSVLNDALETRRISKVQYDDIIAAHPNYVPHYVLDALKVNDGEIGPAFAVGRDTKLKRARGSAREIENPTEAVFSYLLRETTLNGKQRAENVFFDSLTGKESALEVKPLRVAANVEARARAAASIAKVRAEQKGIDRIITKYDKTIRTLMREVNALNKEGLRTKLREKASEKPQRRIGTITVKEREGTPPKIISVTEKGAKITAAETRAFVRSMIHEPSQEMRAIALKIGRRDEKTSRLISELEKFQETHDVLTAERRGYLDEIKAHNDTLVKPLDIPKGFDIFTRTQNGIKEQYLMPTELADALRGGGGNIWSKALDIIQNAPGPLRAIILGPAKITRALTTQYNPVFKFISNPARDLQTVQLTAGASVRDYMEAFTSALAKNDTEKGELYRIINEAGGLNGATVFDDSMTPTQQVQKFLRDQKILSGDMGSRTIVGNGKNLVRKALQEGGQILEDMSRLAAAKKVLREGGTVEQAAKVAANSTVDFSKHGDFSQLVNALVPFFNPRVQGLVNLKKALERNPTEFVRRALTTAAIPASILTAWNSQFKSFYDIPDSDRKLYWNIMVGETRGRDITGNPVTIPHYIRIPKGEAQVAVAALVERILTRAHDKFPEGAASFATSLFKGMSPVTESNLLPAGMQQVVELMTNKSLFRNAPIEPDYTYIGGERFKTSELAAKYHFNEYTSNPAKLLGSIFNVSPEKIDYVIRIGVLNDVMQVFDLPNAPVKGQDASLFYKASQTPFVRSIFRTSNSRGYYYNKAQENKANTDANNKEVERILNRSNQ